MSLQSSTNDFTQFDNLNSNVTIAIIGLGYVGLPLAIEFGKQFNTIGYDIDTDRISQLKNKVDSTLEVDTQDFNLSKNLSFTNNLNQLQSANFYIITVPTPIDNALKPDLTPLISASQTIAKVISSGDIVVYESTVYPGATEDDCIPIIEQNSGLKFNVDFFAGYSPERINPGDKKHRLPTIKKVTSGSTKQVALFVDTVYQKIITAGTHLASSIKVAEAAKVIENTQRDINIALINELAKLFDKLDLDTREVLDAAGSKWNFLPFQPGLVGGHCIGVDPYYLTHKAQQVGYHPEVILAGRKLNDSMGEFIATTTTKLMMRNKLHVVDSNILILGLTFKENCPDLRNTRVIDIIEELQQWHTNISVYDPWASKAETKKIYNIDLIDQLEENYYDACIVCVKHDEIIQLGSKAIRKALKPEGIIYDVKGCFNKDEVDARL